MDRKSFELLYQDAVEALASRRMHDALNCIRGILFNTENPELNRELESVQQDYGMMLTFISQGGTDPQQALVHRNLTHRAFTLLDKSARLYHVRYENDLYAERTIAVTPTRRPLSTNGSKRPIYYGKNCQRSAGRPLREKLRRTVSTTHTTGCSSISGPLLFSMQPTRRN